MACPFGSGYPLQVLATLRFAAGFPLLSLTRESMRFTEHLNTLLEILRKYSKKII
jgi:hypothetical protein